MEEMKIIDSHVHVGKDESRNPLQSGVYRDQFLGGNIKELLGL